MTATTTASPSPAPAPTLGRMLAPPVESAAAGNATAAPATAEDYYDSSSGKYLVRTSGGTWLPHDLNSYRRLLCFRGLSPRLEKKAVTLLDECDLAIIETQDKRHVQGHGPLSGRNAGPIMENGKRYLVTEDMQLPEPRPGEWPVLLQLFMGLFYRREEKDTGRRQLATLYGWLQSSILALRAGRQQPQQALAICGPADCGKSLLQHLITEMLAGRSAKADRYFSGRTEFNADLFAAEHLMLEDNHGSTRIADRLKLGASLKETCVGSTVASLHGKGRNALHLRPWWRVSITLNDDPEAMMILPPLDEHMADKLILLRASKCNFPMPVESAEEKHAFRQQLSAEIPHFLHWLLHTFEIPPECRDPRRYKIETWQHPVLRESLESLSPETALLDLIDLAFREDFDRKDHPELSSADIEARVREYDARSSERLFSYRNACGAYLARLARKHPLRVECRRTAASRNWLLHPPGWG